MALLLASHAAMTSNDPPVALDPSLDPALIKQVYASKGRLHIPGFFTRECADRIYTCLASETPWQLHLNEGRTHYDVGDKQMQLMPEASRVLLLETLHGNAARKQFQCIYNNFPIWDVYHEGRRRELYIMRVYEFLNSPAFLNFAREVTGVPTIQMVDAQATLYRAGHFLTRHEDLDERKRRVAAYVLNFTPEWEADWGGILQFIDKDGHIAEGYTPAFNALNLFRVPQTHSVSFVAPFAKAGRYSITGWLREDSNLPLGN
jgi:SM-20-related protein